MVVCFYPLWSRHFSSVNYHVLERCQIWHYCQFDHSVLFSPMVFKIRCRISLTISEDGRERSWKSLKSSTTRLMWVPVPPWENGSPPIAPMLEITPRLTTALLFFTMIAIFVIAAYVMNCYGKLTDFKMCKSIQLLVEFVTRETLFFFFFSFFFFNFLIYWFEATQECDDIHD